MYQRILLAIDGSHASLLALHQAIVVGKATGAEVEALFVADSSDLTFDMVGCDSVAYAKRVLEVGRETLASAATEVVNLQQLGQQAQGVDIDPAQAAQTARDAAGAATLGLGATIAAAALGGLLGAKMWPRKKDARNDAVSVRS